MKFVSGRTLTGLLRSHGCTRLPIHRVGVSLWRSPGGREFVVQDPMYPDGSGQPALHDAEYVTGLLAFVAALDSR